MLSELITATGLQLEATKYDVECTVLRCELCDCFDEMSWLSRDGIILFLIAFNSKPGDPTWKQAEAMLGENLPTT